ncbi:transposase [Algoriphagus terrigena]|uniref:transposase n=1 Tax=Algoriphagus terrigena TaxID=344884 RepID=UPI0003F98211|nr:transposase [Algoriphagus terrigena]
MRKGIRFRSAFSACQQKAFAAVLACSTAAMGRRKSQSKAAAPPVLPYGLCHPRLFGPIYSPGAISNSRIGSCNEGSVSFRWKDYPDKETNDHRYAHSWKI